MTQAEFLARWRHELGGMVLDAATAGRTGADLALWIRDTMKRIDRHLIQMYADLQPPADGQAETPSRAVP